MSAQDIFLANRAVLLTDVLDELGIEIRGVPSQLACPVHKGGGETRPSAHIYPDNSIYCFTCSRQYGPVEVYAAGRGLDESSAAQRLLEKWPVSEETRTAVLKEFTLPSRPEVSEAILDYLDMCLIRYRGRVSLQSYRDWAKKIDQAYHYLRDRDRKTQNRKVEFFRNQMWRSLNSELNNER